MTAGSALAVISCVLIATADSTVGFAAAWLVAGIAMAAALYGPAFAAITGWFAGETRLQALTVLTVAGGLASTAFAPLTAWLQGGLDWRATYLVLGLGLATTIPVHWWGLRGAWQASEAAEGRRRSQPSQEVPTAIVASRSFLALTAALTITGLCSTAVVVNLIPLLREQGVGLQAASTVLALGGLGQVAGRIGYAPLALRLSPVSRGAVVLGLLDGMT
ncbi:MFS transporter [Knoellia locipacati]|uniref:MFS transporter n=1 Tax=Knoellia locipacati TaxID=882824 RepID=UPI00384BC51D